MRDGSRTGSGRRRLLRREDEPPANEDFLFHLSRGSELLMQNRVVEAKEELERALSHRPTDAQSQDLLAGVYFRLGVYPTAIRIWQALADEFPEDVVLHVNLGLALFKTGQPEDARQALERALELDSDHDRAWGYLGLVRWRLGKLDAAREAFLRGGQASMAHRMEEMTSAGDVPAPEPPPAPEPVDADVTAMRDAAGAAEERVSEQALAVEGDRPRRTTGQWSVVETGAARLPRSRRASRPNLAMTNPRLSAVASSWAVELSEDTPLAVGPEGELLIRTEGSVHARLTGLRAVRGALATEAVERRFRTQGAPGPLGGNRDPIVRWQAPVSAVLRAPAGLRFHALRVDESQLYVHEEFVHAFDDRVGWESGRLPLAGDPRLLLSFHGEGNVALRLARQPSGVEVRDGDEVRVDPDALIGWTGRLFPRTIDDPELPGMSLSFRGQGILLVI
ncbi:MAG: tetratricopeptide repeat protein [Sandaracinaceae bacterium]